MPYSRLFVLVEGVDDAQFIDEVLLYYLSLIHEQVDLILYAEQPPRKIDSLIYSVRRMRHADYLIVADKDDMLCIRARKEQVIGRYPSAQCSRIVIVNMEIESWYLAGLTPEACRELGFAHPRQSEGLCKEAFMDLKPHGSPSKIVFQAEICHRYCLGTALANSPSLTYLIERHIGAVPKRLSGVSADDV